MKELVYEVCKGSDVQLPGVPPFVHINQNDCSGRKHIKLKEEDIAICECKYDANDPASACGERCLNVLTNTECVPGYCPCAHYCKNQRFQKSEYAKAKLFKTEGRGWGLLADEKITAGQFIIEYCGEVISSEQAKQRSQTYEAQGLRDAYIISLNANYFIDATRKGSLARFINHSCQPNCETRKWTVLGETRVGIFANQDISVGTELAYDYNFEWYGGANVRCLCGAPNCSIFLGGKSHGFQEHNHVWEDGDDRYTVDEFPLYDSAEDEPLSRLPKSTSSFVPQPLVTGEVDYSGIMDGSFGSEYHQFESTTLGVEARFSGQMDGEGIAVETEVKVETQDAPHAFPQTNAMISDIQSSSQLDGEGMSTVETKVKVETQDAQHAFPQTIAMISDIQSSSISQDFNIGSGLDSKKKTGQHIPNRRSKHSGRKQFNGKRVAHLFASKQAQEEVSKYEEIRSEATSKLDTLYDEIRPSIEQHERDSLDSIPTSVAEKWIEATCSKWKADIDLSFSIFEHVLCPAPMASGESNPSKAGNNPSKAGNTENAVNHSTN